MKYSSTILTCYRMQGTVQEQPLPKYSGVFFTKGGYINYSTILSFCTNQQFVVETCFYISGIMKAVLNIMIWFLRPSLRYFASNLLRSTLILGNKKLNVATIAISSKGDDNFVTFLPFEGCSIQGPFIMFKMLHASLYWSSGSNFGVSKKHLYDIDTNKKG